MRTLILFLLSATAALADDMRAFMWQESRDEKTGEPRYAFYVGPEAVKAMVEASVRGDDAEAEKIGLRLPANARLYAVLLTGNRKVYPKEKITVGSGHDIIDVVSGTIEINLSKRDVKVALKVVSDGKEVSFPGNGTFTVSLPPKK